MTAQPKTVNSWNDWANCSDALYRSQSSSERFITPAVLTSVVFTNSGTFGYPLNLLRLRPPSTMKSPLISFSALRKFSSAISARLLDLSASSIASVASWSALITCWPYWRSRSPSTVDALNWSSISEKSPTTTTTAASNFQIARQYFRPNLALQPLPSQREPWRFPYRTKYCRIFRKSSPNLPQSSQAMPTNTTSAATTDKYARVVSAEESDAIREAISEADRSIERYERVRE